MKPKILVFGTVNDEMTLGLGNQYSRAIELAGGLPLAVPYIEKEDDIKELIDYCDGVFFTGGADVDPKNYGEAKSDKCGEAQKYRDTLEIAACRAALKADKAILGICRGSQLINVALGGSLYQDLPSEIGTSVQHVQTEHKNDFSHSVSILAHTPFALLADAERVRVNSFHHQAIKRLGEGLVPMAYADDNVTEAVYSTSARYLRAYQWHPERLIGIDEISRNIFADFVNACKN